MKLKNKTIVLRISIVCISIAFIGIGMLRKEHLEVLEKAVKICLECIGIG